MNLCSFLLALQKVSYLLEFLVPPQEDMYGTREGHAAHSPVYDHRSPGRPRRDRAAHRCRSGTDRKPPRLCDHVEFLRARGYSYRARSRHVGRRPSLPRRHHEQVRRLVRRCRTCGTRTATRQPRYDHARSDLRPRSTQSPAASEHLAAVAVVPRPPILPLLGRPTLMSALDWRVDFFANFCYND